MQHIARGENRLVIWALLRQSLTCKLTTAEAQSVLGPSGQPLCKEHVAATEPILAISEPTHWAGLELLSLCRLLHTASAAMLHVGEA